MSAGGTAHVLIVEADADIGAELARIMTAVGYSSECALDLKTATESLKKTRFDAVLLDLGLPGEDGISAVVRVIKESPGARIVALTSRNEAALAIEAIRAGATDYLVKPWRREVLLASLEKAILPSQGKRAVTDKRSVPLQASALIGESNAFKLVVDQARLAAETSRIPVLLSGECGTGKDVVGREIHRWSPRAGSPFVTINAACLPGTLLESELFGHEAGAFTDAKASRRGLFEQANGGTLFLDEIGEMPLDLQPKLLRVLEGHPFRRLGGEREITTDVRLVAATNRNLPDMIARGTFREDLYYRLSVFELVLPPLRKRGVDVRILAEHFLVQTARAMERLVPEVTPRAFEKLLAYAWPGNVRELRNVIERALVLSRGEPIDLEHLPVDVRSGHGASRAESHGFSLPSVALSARITSRVGSHEEQQQVAASLSLESAIRTHVTAVFEQLGRNLTKTSEALGITRVSLRKKLREYGFYPVK
jgi:two-component system, NtrC family, response regulator AtoC